LALGRIVVQLGCGRSLSSHLIQFNLLAPWL
jgi:hypothetical protein